MEGEREAIGEKLAEHRHLFVKTRLGVAGSRGLNVVVVGVEPGGASDDGLGREGECGGDEGSGGEVESLEALRGGHASDAASGPVERRGFDGRDFECLGERQGAEGDSERGELHAE